MKFTSNSSLLFYRILVALSLVLSVGISADAQLSVVQQVAKLLPNDGADGDQFGKAVAISERNVVIGASHDDDNGDDSGSAYLFDLFTGQQITKLLPNDGAAGDRFGTTVAISGTNVIVGAITDDDNGSDSGSVYLFDAATGQQVSKFLPDDGDVDDYFGSSIAISGSTLIVGARLNDDNGSLSGSAYLFDITTGQQITKLLPNDGAEEDYFGRSVAISGTTAVVGAWGDDDNGLNSGSAYLFDTTTGQQITKLLPIDGAVEDQFGWSVAINETTAIVGAVRDEEDADNGGSVYLFDIATGQQTAKLVPDDAQDGDRFGYHVSVSGTTIIIGAITDDDNGSDSGSAYLFDITTGLQCAKILPDDGMANDQFGFSVAINGTSAVVGARKSTQSGAAYLFDYFCPVRITADSLVVSRGTYVAGGVVELTESDNLDLSIQRSIVDIQSRTEFEVKAFSPTSSPSWLEVTLEGAVFARTPVNQSIELFDYVAGQWEQVDTRLAVRITDSTVTVAATGDLSRFVETGTMCMEARIRYQSANPRQQFASNTDQFIWMIR